MKLSLKEAKELYTLLYFEAIDGKEYFMDKLEEFIYDVEPDFDFDAYLISQGWTLLEIRDSKYPQEFLK